MAKTEEKSKKKPARPKKGLHGWKAALAVFGCGTLAAFGVFGVIVGISSLFFSTLSSGVDSGEQAADQVGGSDTGEPIDELPPGELDLCAMHVQYTFNNYVDGYSSGNYEDPAEDGEEDDRVVSDTCEWDITPPQEDGLYPWQFTFSYESVIATPGDASSEEVASDKYEEFVASAGISEVNILSSGKDEFGDRSDFFYGENDGGGFSYILIGQERSSVYTIHFTSDPEGRDITEDRFRREARKVVSDVAPGFRGLVPED